MQTYFLNNAENGVIEFTDPKRWYWALAIFWSLIPVAMIAVYLYIENSWLLILPLEAAFFLIPVLDHIFGTDARNPPEEIVPQLNKDPYYQRLLMFAVPAHFITVLAAVYLVGNYQLEPIAFVGFALIIGVYSGLSINTAHEIGHKNTKFERLMSRIVLSLTGYGHFCSDHNFGHHRDVATPEDPASSRMGESIYRFMLREIPGAARRGWQAEVNRLSKRGKSTWSLDNHILQSYALTLLFQGSLSLIFGWPILLFFILHNAMAWFQLTSANYIEHYGLLRAKKPNGKYERCQPHHSWNANHLVSNLLLFQLERHSDHHANPSRPYQSLRSFDNLPELPSGYFGMYILAYIPSLWFKVMDKALMEIPHINGDLSKVNIDPRSEAKIRARWGD